MKKLSFSLLFLMALAISSCGQKNTTTGNSEPEAKKSSEIQPAEEYVQDKNYDQYEVATFAGGCFWCIEASFARIQGVKDVLSGYSGGHTTYPTYEDSNTGRTGHAEAVQIYYDPQEISFEKLLEIFFVAHDPTQLDRQGPDVGTQYRSAIFYHGEAQKAAVDAYIQKLDASGKFDRPIVTEVKAYEEFWVAEAYHQDYYEHHPENPYIQRVSRPKVEKVMKTFKDILKPAYKS